MPHAKKSPRIIDLKKLRSSIQEDEKNYDKLSAPVGEKIPASKYMPYRFDSCTIDENTTKTSYDTLLKLRTTPNRIIKLMLLFKH